MHFLIVEKELFAIKIEGTGFWDLACIAKVSDCTTFDHTQETRQGIWSFKS